MLVLALTLERPPLLQRLLYSRSIRVRERGAARGSNLYFTLYYFITFYLCFIVYTCTRAVSACEKGEQPEEALRLLRQMVELGLHPTVISYSAAILACEKGGQWEAALEVLEEMQV